MQDLYKCGKALVNEINETVVPKDTVSFWSLGQAGILLKGRKEDGLLCIDPYLSYRIEDADPETEFKRAFPPVLEPAMLPYIDGLLATHEHDDHLDFSTIKAITSENMKIAVPAPIEGLLHDAGITKKILSARVGETFFIKGFKIIPVPAAHTEYEVDEQGNHRYLGYLIEVNGIRLFHSGDTLITPEVIEKVKEFKPHVAFLPINGGDYFRTDRGIVGNMSFREAADFSVLVGVDLVIPIHFDLFPNNRDNPAYFVDYLFQHYPTQKFHMMVAGERFIYHK
jgi:L-ascorbate metabolism protein UlaG (beta-lactamase superfamily)